MIYGSKKNIDRQKETIFDTKIIIETNSWIDPSKKDWMDSIHISLSFSLELDNNKYNHTTKNK